MKVLFQQPVSLDSGECCMRLARELSFPFVPTSDWRVRFEVALHTNPTRIRGSTRVHNRGRFCWQTSWNVHRKYC